MQEVRRVSPGSQRRVLFCWSDISGYMASCWQALARLDGIQVSIIAFAKSDESSFQKELTKGLDIQFVSRTPAREEIASIVDSVNPGTIVLCGWFVPAYRALVEDRRLSNRVRFVLAMDTPWRGTTRQMLGRYLLRSFVRKIDVVLTSGERSYQYARRLGARKIFKFQYGVDTADLYQAYKARKASNWPRRFIFVGRYAPEKGISVLVEAYHNYRAKTADPWPLHTYGQGPLKDLLQTDGIVDHGFVQPHNMREHWALGGCLVLASTFDPWPLIVVEACAAGLPVIVTHAAGSQVEVVKMYYNGLVIEEGSVEAMTNAFLWMHAHDNLLMEMGERSVRQAEPYGADIWAAKISYLIDGLR